MVCLGGKALFVSALPLDWISEGDGASVLTAELYQKCHTGNDELSGCLENHHRCDTGRAQGFGVNVSVLRLRARGIGGRGPVGTAIVGRGHSGVVHGSKAPTAICNRRWRDREVLAGLIQAIPARISL